MTTGAASLDSRDHHENARNADMPSAGTSRADGSAHPWLRLDLIDVLADLRIGVGRSSRHFALAQRVLGGAGGASTARAWFRRFWWRAVRRERGRGGAAVALCVGPWVVLREARRAVAVHGGAVRAAYGVSTRTQLAQLCWLGLRYGLRPRNYYLYALFRRDRRRRARDFVQGHEAVLLYRLLAAREALDDFRVTEDKQRFARWCARHALPTVPILATFQEGRLVGTSDAQELPALPACDLFSKPTRECGGVGTVRWSYVAPDRWRRETTAADGTTAMTGTYERHALFAALAAQSRACDVILQRRLVNDPALTPLSGGGLCTLRLMTMRAPRGRPELVTATYRMSVGGSHTDNFTGGGIAADVDVATGRIGAGVRPDPRLVARPLTHHPDTGAEFVSRTLPYWADARALCLRAHACLPSIACVGWDVVLTPDGPILLECNFAPGVELSQAPTGRPLADTPFVRYFDAHLRRSFAHARDAARAEPHSPTASGTWGA